MGADMLMACVSWEKGQALNWDAGFKLISDLDQETLKDIWGLYSLTTKDDLKVKLEALKSAVEGDSRCTVQLSFGHLNVLIAGGVSYGDAPSDIYRDMSDLEEVPGIHDAVGFNREDFIDYKSILMKVLEVMKDSKQLPCLIHLDDKLDPMLETMLRSGSKPKRKKVTK